jgi:hypothetical protein
VGQHPFGIRELEQRNGESTVEAYAWDVETNTRQVKAFQVQHKRHTKQGSYALTDPRDIYEMVANQGARRLRACILGVIPGDVIDAAVRQCEVTLKSKMDITPDFIQSVVEAFAPFGVTKEQLEKRIQRRMDTLTPPCGDAAQEDPNSLKEGMSTPADWFEAAQAAESEDPAKAAVTGNAGAKEALRKRPCRRRRRPLHRAEEARRAGRAYVKDALAFVNRGRLRRCARNVVKSTERRISPTTTVRRSSRPVRRHKAGEKIS